MKRSSFKAFLVVALASVSSSVFAETVDGANVHAEFERVVPTVCYIKGNADSDGSAVHSTGTLLFADENISDNPNVGAEFEFVSNAGDGTGELKLLRSTAEGQGVGSSGIDGDGFGDGEHAISDTEVSIYVANGNEDPELVQDGNFVQIKQGTFKVFAKLNQSLPDLTAGDVMQADAFFKASNQGGELDCGVNDYKYNGSEVKHSN